MIKFKGVLLDIDNTLYDYKNAHEKAYDKVIEYIKTITNLDVDYLHNIYNQAKHDIYSQLYGTAACHNRLLYFQRMFELLEKNSMFYALDCYELYWEIFLENMHFRSGFKPLLEFLSQQTKICFITDLTAHIQYRKIKELDLARFVHCIVSSEEVGKEKPHQDIFLCALKKLSLQPADVCMVGDDYERDVIGAVSLGIKTFWLTEKSNKELFNYLIMPFSSATDLERLLSE